MPPNVLMVLADQHHAGLMGCAGHPQAITPNLDALAKQGVRFADAYCQNPICTPSRVSILSGQYCHNHGYFGLSGPIPADQPGPGYVPNLFGHFRRLGYRTAGYGKLHLPESPHNWVAHDLDVFADGYESPDGVAGVSHFLSELEALGLRDREDSWHNFSDRYGPTTIGRDSRPSDMPYEHTLEMWCAREAMRFMEKAQIDDTPFCIQVAFQKPHHPLLPQQQFWDMYDEDLALPPSFHQDPSHRPPHFQRMFEHMREMPWEYAQPGESFEDGARRAWRGTLACITQIDDVFGRLMRFLDEKGLAENTVVIYGSDHGCYHGIHGLPEKAPGIGSDAVCRVPMIWRGPGITAADTTSRQLVENIDMAPTLTSLCGLPAMQTVDGQDLSLLLGGDDEPVRVAALTENALSKAVRFERWRLTYYPEPVFNGEYLGELYDLEADPDETNNLYNDPEHREVVARGMRLIIDRLAASRRVVTCQGMTHDGSNLTGKRRYHVAEDGRLPTDQQPVRNPQSARFVNYL